MFWYFIIQSNSLCWISVCRVAIIKMSAQPFFGAKCWCSVRKTCWWEGQTPNKYGLLETLPQPKKEPVHNTYSRGDRKLLWGDEGRKGKRGNGAPVIPGRITQSNKRGCQRVSALVLVVFGFSNKQSNQPLLSPSCFRQTT